MSKDQAAMLRALVQGQANKIEESVGGEESEGVSASVFTPFSLKKPSQILKPKLEVVVESTGVESLNESSVNTPEKPVVESTQQKGLSTKQLLSTESGKCLSDTTQPTEAGSEKVESPQPVELEVVRSESTEEVDAMLQTVKPLAQAEEGVRILAVCSGKGGVGKTNVVLNLAIALKRQGKNPLIIDTDFGFTNIDVLCGVVAPYSLQNVLTGDKTLKDIIVEGPEGVKIIPGGNDVVHLNDMSVDHKKVFQEQFSQLEGVDVLLIDMGAGVSKTSLLYTMFAQEILLVVTPEPTSLTDAYSLLKTMELSHFEHQVKVVVNRVVNEEESIRTFKKLEATVSNFLERITLEYVSCIHDDPVVSGSVKAQIPFLIKHPESTPAKDVLKLMEVLFELQQPKKRFKNMQQVFGRLMRVFG